MGGAERSEVKDLGSGYNIDSGGGATGYRYKHKVYNHFTRILAFSTHPIDITRTVLYESSFYWLEHTTHYDKMNATHFTPDQLEMMAKAYYSDKISMALGSQFMGYAPSSLLFSSLLLSSPQSTSRQHPSTK
jgi:hypothetical protein